jgi:hypothetical protein
MLRIETDKIGDVAIVKFAGRIVSAKGKEII